jgi:hypothetical protein
MRACAQACAAKKLKKTELKSCAVINLFMNLFMPTYLQTTLFLNIS